MVISVRVPPLFRSQLCVLLLALGSAWPLLLWGDEPTTEYKVKAAMIFNLVKFVKWPEEGPGGSAERDVLEICIMGRDPFGHAIDAVAGKRVRGLTVHVRRLGEDPKAVPASCQVLFVTAQMESHLPAILRSIGDRPVLTVGDVDDFSVGGGIVELTLANRKIGLKVNRTVADSFGFRIASQLLSVATIVQ